MRFIFSKVGLTLLLVLFSVLLVGGGVLTQSSKLFSTPKSNPEPTIPFSKDGSKDTTPAIVRWIVETSQPIASELRAALNSWWEKEKAILAEQLIHWLANQQQQIASGIQTQLREMIINALGVKSASSQ